MVPSKKRSGVHIHIILEQGLQPLNHCPLLPLLGRLPSRVLCPLVLECQMILLLDWLDALAEEASYHADPTHSLVRLASCEPLHEGDHLLHLFAFPQGTPGVLNNGSAADI